MKTKCIIDFGNSGAARFVWSLKGIRDRLTILLEQLEKIEQKGKITQKAMEKIISEHMVNGMMPKDLSHAKAFAEDQGKYREEEIDIEIIPVLTIKELLNNEECTAAILKTIIDVGLVKEDE